MSPPQLEADPDLHSVPRESHRALTSSHPLECPCAFGPRDCALAISTLLSTVLGAEQTEPALTIGKAVHRPEGVPWEAEWILLRQATFLLGETVYF